MSIYDDIEQEKADWRRKVERKVFRTALDNGLRRLAVEIALSYNWHREDILDELQNWFYGVK